MRPLEILLLLVNLLAFLSLILPGAPVWLRLAAPISLAAAAAQVFVEGQRWQMMPAYALTVIFFLIWLAQTLTPASAGAPLTIVAPTPVGRVLVGLGVVLGVLVLVLSAALPALMPVFSFPRPGGPYAVGTLTYHWIDDERAEIFSTDPAARRELMVQVWYPAEVVDGSGTARHPAPWAADSAALAPALARLLRQPEFIFGYLQYVTTNAVQGAPAAAPRPADGPAFPVLIFSHGLLGFRTHNTFQVEELVSRGYIVAAVDHPYVAAAVVFPDGRQVSGLSREEAIPLVRQSYAPAAGAPLLNGSVLEAGIIPYLAQDVSFTLDQLAALNRADPNGILAGRMDLSRAAMFGVSMGGLVTAEACSVDPRLKACLSMDAPFTTASLARGLTQPLMIMTRDAATMRLERERAGGFSEQDIAEHLNTMRAAYDGAPGAAYFLQVPGIFHLNFLDLPQLTPLASWIGLTGPLDGRRGHAILNAYTVAFFDHHLKGLPAPLLDGPSDAYPETIFESRR